MSYCQLEIIAANVPGTQSNLAAASSTPASINSEKPGTDILLFEGKSGSEIWLLTSSDIRLNACRFDNSLAISAGEVGDDPSSALSRAESGIGAGDVGANRDLLRVGLFRSGEYGLLSMEGLRWYDDPVSGVDSGLELVLVGERVNSVRR
jgi:hypothetical protein